MNDKISSVEVFDNSNNCSEPPICPAVNLSDYSTTGIAQLDVCTPADTTPPTATWISPANNSTIRAQSVTLKANATDNSSGVDYVRFSAKYGGSWHNLYYDYSAPYEYTWDLCAADVPNGEIELGLQAYDKAGNEFVYSEHYANYKIYKDYTCGSPPAPTPAPSDLVKLYHQANYGGDPFWTGGAGNHGNINPLQFTYSMRVPNNWSVETFSDYNFGGQKQCWAGSVAKLGDYGWTSEVKSLKAYTSNVCPNPPPPGGQWQAKFWRTGTCYDDHSQCTSGNTTHQSQPSVPGVVGGRNYIIKEDWGQNSPGGSTPVDDWSGYFETTINFPAGNYVFYATHDDGLKLKIGSYGERSTSDERIDSDRLCNDQPYYLNGNTKVEAYLHERGGDATIQIWYDTNTAACVKPEAPALWWPDHQSTINDTTPAFDWLAISGGVEYRIQVADNANFTNAVINTTTTATNYTPGTALAYNTYYWRVQAKNGYNNWSNWSDIRQVTIAPVSVPTIAATDGLYTDKVQITWNSVSGATGYEVYRAASYSGSKTKLATVSTTTYNDTSAVADTVYYYWVKACNGSTCSNYSNYDSGWRSVSVSPPANVQASDGAFTDNVRVTWNGVSGATSYEVWRHTADNSAAAAKIAAAVTGTGYDDFAAALGQTYYYWVKAKNNAGTSGFSSSDSGHRLAPIPNQPGDPYEVSVTASSLTFGWTDNAANETGFKLYKWSGVAVDFVYHDQVGANVTTYTDTNLNCDSKYWYKVTAFNTYGESPQTGWLEAQTASCAPLDNTAPTFPVNDPGTGSPLIEPAGGVVINTPRPTFDWHDAVDDVGVAGYTLRITGSTQPIILAAGATDIDTVQSFYTPTFDLVDGTYTWTVQAYDAAGNRTSFVTAEAFTIATAFNDDQKVYLPLLTK
ncbi:MAG: DUF4962 domain-containing protein [Anaerolineales bacterium]|nr:DUF4962 domain-containing protein [Anaerolineales bacterium]